MASPLLLSERLPNCINRVGSSKGRNTNCEETLPDDQEAGRPQMDDDTDHAEIRRLAYQIWLQEGQPEGRDREHWAAAKAAWAMKRRSLQEVDEQQPAPAADGSAPTRRGTS